MNYRYLLIIILSAVTPALAFSQPAWWTPESPVIGQPFTVYYDDIAGALPNNSPQCWLHWGIVHPPDPGWTAPPSSIWPPGSQISPDGYACQSPMTRGLDNYWYVAIDPDTTIENLQFVFTDLQNNWDSNGGNNWQIDFISGDIASWWIPETPLPGDEVTIYYNTIAGTLPNNASNVKLHWGINEIGSGNWIEPPASMWPPGTIPIGDNHAVQTPMLNQGGGIWQIPIQTNDTTYTLHYVVTDGSNWDNNGGANWNIYLQQPPPAALTYHTFRYDTRSRWATWDLADINTVRVAGTFNGWSTTANPMTVDSNGVFKTEIQVQVGSIGYKFVINGSNWTQDPDNPVTDGSQYMNSRVVTEADTLPYFINVLPGDNSVYHQGEYLDISAVVRSSDSGPGIMGEPYIVRTVFGFTDTMDVNYNPATGLLTAGFQIGAPYTITLEFFVEDSASQIGSFTQYVVPVAMFEGFAAKDCKYDDVGDGDYSYPAGYEDCADLEGLMIAEWADGDSLAISVNYWEQAFQASTLLQICTEVDGFFYAPPLFDNETSLPDWNGTGLQICLKDPVSSGFDPAIHNRIINMRDPVSIGIPVTYEGGSYFKIAVSDLETVMGSYNRGWYWSVCSFLDGPAGTFGHSWEVDALHGGSDEVFDPDVFDLMFVDDRELQKILLSNYSGNRRASLDNVGRGFVLIYPEDIGPNVGSSGPQIDILTRGAPTIFPEQTITGIADLTTPAEVTIHQQYSAGQHIFTIPGIVDTFQTDITLEEGVNTIWAEASESGETSVSPAIIFELQIDHYPEAFITVTVDGQTVILDASATVDPDSDVVDFLWEADADNPEPAILQNANQAVCTFTAPDTPGEYYFDLALEDPAGNITYARTFAAVYADSVHGFEWNESAQWVRDAIIYEIFPRSYSPSHQLSAITADMERIYLLGLKAIWLMPIFPGPTDHGYAIVDYYGIEEDYGTPEDFADLVETAHSYDIKIILDLVINHTSIEHPFMQDAQAYGTYSHYYDYYDRDAQGNYTYYYDWLSLPNVNYDNLEVWDYFIDMCKFWVEQYDVDGYRCDVAWGPQQRNPAFWVEWREELKKLKPEIFLLAEATSTDFDFYDYRFDSAYDWNLHHEAPVNLGNMFNGVPNINQLHDAITNYGYPYPPYKFPFRFMENHDEDRYIVANTPDETRTAATLLLTIPGIPMIYAGQEIGTTSQRGQIDWSTDPNNMWPHYNKLTQIRNLFPAVRSDTIERLYNSQYSTVYSYGRFMEGEDPVITVINFTPGSQIVTITVPSEEWGLHPDSTYCLNEFIGGNHYWMTGSQLASITTSIDGRKSRVYAITDTIVTLGVEENPPPAPMVYTLRPSYPNPFNQECIIGFQIPKTEKVRIAVYNILGQRVAMLADGVYSAGDHIVRWNGKTESGISLSSGIYFYQVQAGNFMKTQKMALIR